MNPRGGSLTLVPSSQECESEGANKMVEYLRDLASKSKQGDSYGTYCSIYKMSAGKKDVLSELQMLK